MLSKTTGLALIIATLFGLEYSKIYVPATFERPHFFKLNYIAVKSFATLAKLAAAFNYGTELGNFRYIVTFLSKFVQTKNENIKIVDTKIENVPVRIYSPVTSDQFKLPLMIYFHGGAYVFGSSDEFDPYLSELAIQLNIKVVSVNYRLAPEFPYPAAINDCYSVTNYIVSNPNQFNADKDKFILAGDSSGGNAVAVITQKLLTNNQLVPKLQILIYPRTQMVNFRLPSYMKYDQTGLMNAFTNNSRKFIAYYLGISNATEEVLNVLSSNLHTALVDDNDIKNRIINNLNIDQMPKEYKENRDYYNSYETQKQFYYSFDSNLDESNLLRRDSNTAILMKKVFSVELSPLLADLNQLKGLPKAYFIICEWDALKDEGLMYAERLKSAGVEVNVAFYENAFHGIVGLIDENKGYKVAREMLKDLVIFITNNI